MKVQKITKKPKNLKSKIPKKVGSFGIGEIVIGLFASILLFVGLLAKPTYTILNHVVVFNDGIIAPAIIFGAMTWAIIEAFTPPGKSIIDLIWRAVIGFALGGIIGGFLGYEFAFAQYVIIPSFNGNTAASIYLVAILIFGLIVIWDAAWSHRKGYMGQKGKKVKILSTSESGSGKGARKMLGLLVALIAVFLMIPLSASIGGAVVSSHDNSSVLQSQSIVSYVFGSGSAVPFGQVNGTATFEFPTIVEKNSTGSNITVYQDKVWIKTNLTVAEMNNFAVAKLVLETGSSKSSNISIGTGENVSSFQPFLYQSVKNLTSNSFKIQSQYLTGNQSSNVMIEIQSNVSSISLSLHAYGNNGINLLFGSYSAEQTGYFVGTIFTLISAALVAPWYDFPILDRKSSKKGGK